MHADAFLLVQIPAGGTAALYIAIDGTDFAGDYNENPGTAGAFCTLRRGNVAYTPGTAMNAARIITVRLAVPAGTVTTARNTPCSDFVNIEVRPYADL